MIMANKGQQNAQVFDTDDPDRIQDIGWTKKTEGILSKTIDLNKNTLEAFSESSKGGTLNFSSGNNIIVADGQA